MRSPRCRVVLAVAALGALHVFPGGLEARTIAEVLATLGERARGRLAPHFRAAGVPYPPPRVFLLAFKKERQLEVWAETRTRRALVHTYPILAASGQEGPKLRQGDGQVPEGSYRIVLLNPNSLFHLSMKLDYPNAFDRQKARRDGRKGLGGDIFIHGSAVSIGCLAMGDGAIEELFVLVADIGLANVRVVIAPRDLRREDVPEGEQPHPMPWAAELYRSIKRELDPFALGSRR